MSIQPAAAKKPGLLRRMRHYRNIYLMLLPVIIFYILFHYVPMGGLAIAFENYKPAKGILGSDWVGLKNFRKFLTGIYAWRVIRNTLTLNLLLLLFGFPAPILLALMINEMRENWYKKTIQTVSYMPHFVALVVVCGLLREFCLTTGLINDIIAFFGGTRPSPPTRYCPGRLPEMRSRAKRSPARTLKRAPSPRPTFPLTLAKPSI